MASVLEISNVSKRFGDFTAVDNLSLEVEEGSFFSILGPSGCGKTTLLRMIAGFLAPSTGTIRIGGHDMAGVPPNKRPVNLVFQNLALFPMMNVQENIAFGLRRRKVPASEISRRVDAMLERVELGGYGPKRINQLSGGQKQRVAIARSLVLEPSLLLLDEPLGALDLKLREQMKIELKKLQAQVGTTFLYITHDQSEALVMSDRVAVMNSGRFEQVDSPRALYAQPGSRFVADFVGDTNVLKGTVVSFEPFRVKIITGQEILATPGEPLNGEQVDVFLRPEAIMIGVEGKGNEHNRFSLVVRSVLFDGSNTRLLVNIEGSEGELRVALPQDHRFDHIGPGDRLDASVHLESCRCYDRREQ